MVVRQESRRFKVLPLLLFFKLDLRLTFDGIGAIVGVEGVEVDFFGVLLPMCRILVARSSLEVIFTTTSVGASSSSLPLSDEEDEDDDILSCSTLLLFFVSSSDAASDASNRLDFRLLKVALDVLVPNEDLTDGL
jgi:hypothetical protein